MVKTMVSGSNFPLNQSNDVQIYFWWAPRVGVAWGWRSFQAATSALRDREGMGIFFWRVTGTTNEPWWSIVDIVPEPDFIYIYNIYIYKHWYTHISIYIYTYTYTYYVYIYYRGYSILGFIMVCPTMEKPWCTIYGQPGVRQRPALSELVASDRPIAPAPSSAVEACEFQHEPNTI